MDHTKIGDEIYEAAVVPKMWMIVLAEWLKSLAGKEH